MRGVFAILWLAIAGVAWGQVPIDPARATRYFQEAKWASEDDNGNLWRRTLYGPILFADPRTRTVVANQPDKMHFLHKQGSIWAGVLPDDMGIANTAVQWGGVRWTMVMWNALAGPQAIRVQLMMHECWHRVQGSLGLPPKQEPNAHLDTHDGRYWLRLEWRALAAALVGIGDQRPRATTDALIFRAYRRSLFPGSAATEDRMEMHEGLAEYTGVHLMGLGDWSRGAYMAGRVKTNEINRPTYPLSFAYETGPCYGILLDDTDKQWRSRLNPDSSLSLTLQTLAGITLPTDLEAAAKDRANAYGGAALATEEDQREQTRKTNETKWRGLLVDGPILELPIPHSHYTYDPNEIFPLAADGTVFATTRIADDWGVIDVKNGARLNVARDIAFVAAPATAVQLFNSNWTLTLKPGWHLVPGARNGDFKVVKG
jgi:hypothetical protein